MLEHFSLRHGHIYVWGDINEHTAKRFIQKTVYLASREINPITILIHSLGGDLEATVAILDEMDMLKHNGFIVKTVALGIAYSAAAFILSMGSKGFRYARAGASIMLHPSSYCLDFDYSHNQERLSDFLKVKNKVLTKRIAEACGQDSDKLTNDIDKGLWLSATEALEYGIIDVITDTPLLIGGNNESETQSSQQRRI